MRTKKQIFCNWKLNSNLNSISSFFTNQLLVDLHLTNPKIFQSLTILPPSIYLSILRQYSQQIGFEIGSQDVSIYTEGAFTGEISALMYADIGCKYTLVAHSERRKYFAENEKTIKDKLEIAVIAGLIGVLCIGENLEERNNGTFSKVLQSQLSVINILNLKNIIIAYEPIWSIGTGITPTIEQIKEVTKIIHNALPPSNTKTPILYGGSVNNTNFAEIINIPEIDGALVGGASLDVKNVVEMLKYLI